MGKNHKIRRGILYGFLTALVSGVSIFYSKTIVLTVPPLVLTTIRNLSVGILFLLFFVLQKKIVKDLRLIKKKDWFYLILIGVLGGALPFYFFFSGLKLIPAQTANLIHKSLFIWVTLLAAFFLGEKMRFPFWLSFILIFLANYYFSPFKFNFNQGEMMVLLATWLWATENILAKKVLKNVSSEVVGLFRMGIGGFILFLAALFFGQTKIIFSLSVSQWQLILPGVLLLFLYVFFWYKALKYAQASLVTLILTFSTVVGNLLLGSFSRIKILPNDIYSNLIIMMAILIIFIKGNNLFNDEKRRITSLR